MSADSKNLEMQRSISARLVICAFKCDNKMKMCVFKTAFPHFGAMRRRFGYCLKNIFFPSSGRSYSVSAPESEA